MPSAPTAPAVFADTVRDAQRRWRFSEQAAHRMALRAMEQYALMLCDQQPALTPCAGEDDLRHALAAGRVPVWLPCALADQADDIHAGWAVTADSLAAWLCRRLGAKTLLLVKSRAAATDSIEALQAEGLLDGAFLDHQRRLDREVYLCGADAAAAFTAALTGSSPPGTRLAAAAPRPVILPAAQAGAP
jgi:aspartokinase-like uncharacterized kinase